MTNKTLLRTVRISELAKELSLDLGPVDEKKDAIVTVAQHRGVIIVMDDDFDPDAESVWMFLPVDLWLGNPKVFRTFEGAVDYILDEEDPLPPEDLKPVIRRNHAGCLTCYNHGYWGKIVPGVLRGEPKEMPMPSVPTPVVEAYKEFNKATDEFIKAVNEKIPHPSPNLTVMKNETN